MASAITLKVGPTTATFVPKASDAQVASTLRDFYAAYNLGPDTLTDQEKMMLVCKWFAGFVHDKAVLKYHEDQRPVNDQEADVIYGVPDVPPPVEP